MQTHVPTTSFGRRPATLGQIAAQVQVRNAMEAARQPGSNMPAAINKWHIFRTLTDIRERLGISDRALSVLNALLTFHPETALTLPQRSQEPIDPDEVDSALPCDLVVFPSNKALAHRAHGMASATLWRNLTALVDAGLILRRDSPNGKRYARKDASGQDRFSDAFGFDLTPLVTRAREFDTLAEELSALRKRRALLKERISLLRRDVSKSIALGLDAGRPGDWEELRRAAMGLMTPLRRIHDDRELEALAQALGLLQIDIGKRLESLVNAQNMMSTEPQVDQHQSISNTKRNTELEPASKEEGGEITPRTATIDQPHAGDAVIAAGAEGGDRFPLGLVMEACPDVRDYGPSGRIATWSDFRAAAGLVRPMIGISPDAWAAAQDILGVTTAHVVVAVILQRSIHSSEAATGEGLDTGVTVNGSPAILSAGGYLRALTEKARAGDFALGPVLMALIGQRLKARRLREPDGRPLRLSQTHTMARAVPDSD